MMEKPLESGITTSVDTTVALTDNVPDVDDSDEARAVVTVHNTSTSISTITPEPPKLQVGFLRVIQHVCVYFCFCTSSYDFGLFYYFTLQFHFTHST